jgi:hypothetical protein
MQRGQRGQQQGQQMQRGQRGGQGQQQGQQMKRGQRGSQQGQGQGKAQNTDRTDRTERRAAMLKRFDADGDGTLNDAERAKLREEMGARRQGQGQGRSQRKGNAQGATPSSTEGIEIL